MVNCPWDLHSINQGLDLNSVCKKIVLAESAKCELEIWRLNIPDLLQTCQAQCSFFMEDVYEIMHERERNSSFDKLLEAFLYNN